MILYEEIDIVESVHQTVLLITVDLEMLTGACGLVGDSLIGEIDLYLGLGVALDAGKEFCQKALAHHNGKHEVVQLVVLMDIGKEGADDHTEAITGNSPGRMFARGTGTEVLACHEDTAAIRGIVEYEIGIGGSIGLIAPVAEQVIAKEFLLASGRLEEACRDNLVSIHILQWQRNTSASNYIEFLFHLYFVLMFFLSIEILGDRLLLL